MKLFLLAIVSIISFQMLQAQDVTYVMFNRDCMSQLEYRYTYPNLKGDSPVWAYSVKPNVLEHYIFMTEGEGHYTPELPSGTVSCKDLDMNDAFVAGINRQEQQMLIVFQRQSGGYWLMPVASATLIARKGTKYWVRAQQSTFQFDTLRLVNEQNLAVAGSPTAAYFSGVKLNNCLMEYSFHCEPVKSGQSRSDIQFIPNLGILNDRSGNSASKAMENELQLVKVNGLALDDFITAACPEGAGKITISQSQKKANYGDEHFEADKELASIMQKEQVKKVPATYSTDANGFNCSENWEPGTHIVQKGENLRAIGRTYKISEQDLIKWNNIQNPDRIEICQKIWLKQPSSNGSKNNPSNSIKVSTEHSVPVTSGKTVKKQGLTQEEKGTPALKLQNSLEKKTTEPNRPIVYSEGASENNTYQNSGAQKAIKDTSPRLHTVARGEYLYKIAKMYGCPEDCLRMANAMPLEGDEPLTIGQELIIPECICTLNGKVIKAPSTVPEKTTPSVKSQSPAPVKQPAKTPKKLHGSILDDTDSPLQYGYDEPALEPVKKSNLAEESTFKNEPVPVGAEKVPVSAIKKPKSETAKVPLFKEHHVKQGETLNSIAAKYKVDAAELSQVNGLDPKEALIPGKLILVPVEDQ